MTILPKSDPYENYPWTTKQGADQAVASIKAVWKVNAVASRSQDGTHWGVQAWVNPTLLKSLL